MSIRFRTVVPTVMSLLALAACSDGSPTPAVERSVSAPESSTGTGVSPSSAPATTAATAGQPFVSASYHYTVTSTDWTGTDAGKTWDGTGSPGNGDPTVDILDGPEGVEAYVFGEPTNETLEQFVAEASTANAKVHPCTAQMPPPTTTTVAGAPAVLEQGHCPPPGGPFVISATVVHGGRAYVFFTVSIPPGSEHFTRNWFLPLLTEIRFTN